MDFTLAIEFLGGRPRPVKPLSIFLLLPPSSKVGATERNTVKLCPYKEGPVLRPWEGSFRLRG